VGGCWERWKCEEREREILRKRCGCGDGQREERGDIRLLSPSTMRRSSGSSASRAGREDGDVKEKSSNMLVFGYITLSDWYPRGMGVYSCTELSRICGCKERRSEVVAAWCVGGRGFRAGLLIMH